MRIQGIRNNWYNNLTPTEQHAVWEFISWAVCGFIATLMISWFIFN